MKAVKTKRIALTRQSGPGWVRYEIAGKMATQANFTDCTDIWVDVRGRDSLMVICETPFGAIREAYKYALKLWEDLE